mmetsp:Transcript_27344/g.71667  ORF Transcript_27344/g.71667 Transcript_27344/m.71667 type:complete len:285 (+) Transcript_27344:1181-2035(+)
MVVGSPQISHQLPHDNRGRYAVGCCRIILLTSAIAVTPGLTAGAWRQRAILLLCPPPLRPAEWPATGILFVLVRVVVVVPHLVRRRDGELGRAVVKHNNATVIICVGEVDGAMGIDKVEGEVCEWRRLILGFELGQNVNSAPRVEHDHSLEVSWVLKQHFLRFQQVGEVCDGHHLVSDVVGFQQRRQNPTRANRVRVRSHKNDDGAVALEGILLDALVGGVEFTRTDKHRDRLSSPPTFLCPLPPTCVCTPSPSPCPAAARPDCHEGGCRGHREAGRSAALGSR